MNYVGCLVSLNCGQVLGTYQGQVKRVDNSTQSLTISQPFRNGIKCEHLEITLSACDIKELKILKNAFEAEEVVKRHATPSKLSKETAEELDNVPSPGRVREVKTESSVTGGGHRSRSDNNAGNRYSYSGQDSGVSSNGREQYDSSSRERYDRRNTPTRDRGGDSPVKQIYSKGDREHSANGYCHRSSSSRDRYDDGRSNARHTPTKDDQFRGRINSGSENRVPHKTSAPRKIEFNRKKSARQDCFSAPVDSILDDFDFEKNLALFDKKAVFEEIESQAPELIRATDKKPTKYRCDENVLQSGPVTLQQIKVPSQTGPLYVTDSGLVVPSISYDLRNKLFDIAEGCGYSAERRIENIGRSSSEMVLQLLGGSSRLNPQNGHQRPTVVVLCGPHMQGAQGLNCARHLLNHGVRTLVFLPNFMRMVQCVEQELKLYEMCEGKRYSSGNDIPTCAVDMIVNCLDSHENSFLRDQVWYQAHVQWVSQSRAPVFTIDPPIETVDITPKWCLYPVLPLAITDSTAQMHLCDLGLPKKVFKDVGITYKSPFSHKFVIAVYPKT